MQTRLIFSNSAKNLDVIRKQLARKYQSIEELFIEIQRNHCSDPDKVDDYMLWHTLIAYDKELAKQDSGLQSQLSPSSPPPIHFIEEIILHTTDFYAVPTPRRMEILEYINKHNPSSVKNLAAETNRDYKNVYDDVSALKKAQVLEFLFEGKNKRPVSRLTGIEISFEK